jgi:glutaminyl-peptide cyclotransferase
MNRWLGVLALLLAVPLIGGGAYLVLRERAAARARELAMVQAEQRAFDAQQAAADDPEKPKFAEDRVPAKDDLKKFPVDGERAHGYVKQLCDIGPRVSATDGMAKQQALMVKHFEGLGGKVTRQEFQARQRSVNKPIPMTNLVVSYFPERTKRVIFCTHYDTRPAAHEEPDRRNWSKPFVSANDGASGVAILMEMAHHLKDFPTGVGVDFVFFDGEEYILDPGTPGIAEGDRYFLGSEHFAGDYDAKKGKLPYRYTAAILLDLCAADGARLAVEGHSWQAAPELVKQVWRMAEAVGAKSFKNEKGFRRSENVLDDHIALLTVGIPAIDVIDFDYPHWHRLTDTPDKVSPKQLAEVGTVLLAWLQTQK